jgi:hypothetical protein
MDAYIQVSEALEESSDILLIAREAIECLCDYNVERPRGPSPLQKFLNARSVLKT